MAEFPVQQFMQEQEQQLAKDCGSWLAQSNNVSAIGHPCERMLVYKRTIGDQATPFTPTKKAALDEGTEQEKFAARLIEDRGYRFERSQEVIHIPDLQIRGKIDGVTYPVGDRSGVKWASEIKTLEQFFSYEKMNTVADLFDSIWHRNWYVQLQLAIYHVSSRPDHDDTGLLWLKPRSHKLFKPIQVPLDMRIIDETFKKCEQVNNHLAAGTLPDRLPMTKGACEYCGFKDFCRPEEAYAAGSNIDDPEFETLLKRREELHDAQKEFNRLDKKAKDVLKGLPYAICGPFAITGKETKKGMSVEIKRVMEDDAVPPQPPVVEEEPVKEEDEFTQQWAKAIQKCKTEAELMQVKEDLQQYRKSLNKEQADYLANLFGIVYDRMVK